MDIAARLAPKAKRGASDLLLSPGAPVPIEVEGRTIPRDGDPLTPEETRRLARAPMTDAQSREFERGLELNLAVSVQGPGRFRANICRQRGEIGSVRQAMEKGLEQGVQTFDQALYEPCRSGWTGMEEAPRHAGPPATWHRASAP